MNDCGYTNENYDLDYSGGCNASAGNEYDNEYSESSNSNSYSGCGSSNGSNGLNGGSASNGFNGGNGQQGQQGQVRTINRNYSVNGTNREIVNKNFINNHISRYNNYYVRECNFVKSFVRDYNMYHYSSQTINNGCVYLGATNVVANNGCGNSSCRCSCR